MLCARFVAFALLACSIATSAFAQTPEITVAARSAPQLGTVLTSFGERGEMFGLNGPAAFLSSYGRFIDDGQPVTAALTFTTKTPMFAAEFVTKDAAAFFAALRQDGTLLDVATGELTKAGSSLRFFVQQSGNKIRLSDNADFLKNIRWPAPEQFTSSPVAVIARIDWRNLQPEMRSAVAQQAMSNFLPQANPIASLSIDALPDLIASATAGRVAGLFGKSENITLQFSIQETGAVQVTADVVNRSIVGRPVVPSPFASLTSEYKVASCEWNTPIESELRTITQAWAAQLTGAAKQMFAGDEIGDTSGLKVLHEGAAILARHCTETIALPNLQATLCTVSNGDQPIIVAGIRVASPARLDSEMQKLIKSAIDNGAPFQFTANVASDNDLSVHRIQLPIAVELANVRELFGESLTIHLATSSHALLVGVGNGSEKFLLDLVSPTTGPSHRWLEATVSSQKKELVAKLGLKPCQLQVLPASQGFQVIANILDNRGPTQLTSTRTETP